MKVSEARGIIWTAVQPDEDTITLPTASNCILLTAPGEFTQKSKIAKNEEMRSTKGRKAGKNVGSQIGTWKITPNLKLSGTAGELSNIHPLLLSLWGNNTVNTGVDVQYTHYKDGDDLVFLTILEKKDFGNVLYKSCIVNTGDFPVKAAAEFLKCDYAGFYKSEHHAGYATLASDIDGTGSAVTAIPLAETNAYEDYDVGAIIVVNDDDNGGQGHEITAIDEGTNTLTITPGVTSIQTTGAPIKPWAPPAVDQDESIVAQYAWYERDFGRDQGKKLGFSEYTFKVDNKFEGKDDQVDFYGTVFHVTAGDREVTINPTSYFTADQKPLRYYLNKNTKIPMTFQIGKEAGKIIQVILPDVRIEDRSETKDKAQKVGITCGCYEENGDDESTFIMK